MAITDTGSGLTQSLSRRARTKFVIDSLKHTDMLDVFEQGLLEVLAYIDMLRVHTCVFDEFGYCMLCSLHHQELEDARSNVHAD